MRLKEREVKDFGKMLGVLEKCDCCRVGFYDDGYAYMVPMNFGYAAKENAFTLYFHCASEGKKLDLLKKCDKVSFEADCSHELVGGPRACDYTFRYASVMGKGKITVADTDEKKLIGLKALMAHYAKNMSATFSEKYLKSVTVLVLEVTEWSCKANEK